MLVLTQRSTMINVRPALEKKRILTKSVKQFHRSEKTSKCAQLLKKRIFNSTEPVKVLPADTRKEPFVEKVFIFCYVTSKESFTEKYEPFRVSDKALNEPCKNSVLHEAIEGSI